MSGGRCHRAMGHVAATMSRQAHSHQPSAAAGVQSEHGPAAASAAATAEPAAAMHLPAFARVTLAGGAGGGGGGAVIGVGVGPAAVHGSSGAGPTAMNLRQGRLGVELRALQHFPSMQHLPCLYAAANNAACHPGGTHSEGAPAPRSLPGPAAAQRSASARAAARCRRQAWSLSGRQAGTWRWEGQPAPAGKLWQPGQAQPRAGTRSQAQRLLPAPPSAGHTSGTVPRRQRPARHTWVAQRRRSVHRTWGGRRRRAGRHRWGARRRSRRARRGLPVAGRAGTSRPVGRRWGTWGRSLHPSAHTLPPAALPVAGTRRRSRRMPAAAAAAAGAARAAEAAWRLPGWRHSRALLRKWRAARAARRTHWAAAGRSRRMRLLAARMRLPAGHRPAPPPSAAGSCLQTHPLQQAGAQRQRLGFFMAAFGGTRVQTCFGT